MSKNSVCKDGNCPFRCWCRMLFSECLEQGLSRGYPGWQSWLSISYCAWVTGSSIVLLVKKENVVMRMIEALFRIL